MKSKSVFRLLMMLMLLSSIAAVLSSFMFFQGVGSTLDQSVNSTHHGLIAQPSSTMQANGTAVPTGSIAATSTAISTPTRNASLTQPPFTIPAPSVTVTLTKVASANNPSQIVAVSDYMQNPSCFLPDGLGPTNPLGIAERCPPPFLPPRAVAVKLVPTATPTPNATPKTTQAKGDAPFSAREMSGEWETIGANQSIWYKVNNQNNFYLDVWLDAYGRTGIGFLAFSPEQANDLSATTSPKGRGAPSKADPSHDLMWRGAQASGTWYFLVTNTTNDAIKYKIGNKQASEDRNCRSYWEYLSTGQYVFWTACR
jgi:hypothetical protein